MNAIAAMTNQLAPIPAPVIEPLPDAEALNHCRVVIEMACAARDMAEGDRLAASLDIGEACLTVREILKPTKGYEAWIRDKTKLSPHWARQCIRAFEAMQHVNKLGAPVRNKVLSTFRSVEDIAALLPRLISGEDVLAIADATTPKVMGRPKVQKLVIDRTPDAGKDPEPPKGKARVQDVETVDLSARAEALDKREADITRRERVLDAKEKRLNDWEADLTRRAALIGGAGATDVVSRETSAGENALEAARAAVRKPPKTTESMVAAALAKAQPKATSDAQSAAKDKVRATPPARAKKAPVIAPETVEAIKDAAQRAVGEAPTEAAKITGAIDTLSAGGAVDVNEVL